jgi:hypothetical protein
LVTLEEIKSLEDCPTKHPGHNSLSNGLSISFTSLPEFTLRPGLVDGLDVIFGEVKVSDIEITLETLLLGGSRDDDGAKGEKSVSRLRKTTTGRIYQGRNDQIRINPTFQERGNL